jgi:hypothetical protein
MIDSSQIFQKTTSSTALSIKSAVSRCDSAGGGRMAVIAGSAATVVVDSISSDDSMSLRLRPAVMPLVSSALTASMMS